MTNSTKIPPGFHAAVASVFYCQSMRRAFVIQLRQEADPGAEFVGRVEHVDSGRAGHFGSAEELIGFIQRTVAEIEGVEEGQPEE